MVTLESFPATRSPVRTARTRRMIGVIIAVWLFGLLVVLALWQQVDAACRDGGATEPALTDCAPVPGAEAARGTTTSGR